MTDKTQNSDKPEGQLSAEDLGLISPSLEDETKTDQEIFDEIGAEETAAANGEDLDDADASVSASASDDAGASDDAAAGSGDLDEGKDKQAGGVPSDQDDEGTQTGDAVTAADKLWEGANDGQRAAFKAAQDNITKLEQSDRSNRGRVSTLQRQLNDITRQFDAAASKDAAAGKGEGDGTATNAFLGSKAWKDFESEYPEIAGPFGTVVAGLQSEIADQGKKLDAVGDDRHQDDVDEQEEILEGLHPKWQDIASDPLFGTWLESQPRHMREAAVRNANEIVDAREAADVIGRFTAFRSEQSDDSAGSGNDGEGDELKSDDQKTVTSLSGKRRRQLEASSGARSTGAATAHGIPEDGDEEAIWDAFDKKEAREAAAAAR